MHVLDHVEWDPRPDAEILAEVESLHPLWLRTANFYQRSLAILDALPRPQSMLWRVEFWGTDGRFPQVPTAEGVDPARYAKDLLALGHRIVPYTYVAWNRPHLVDLVPVLGDLPFHLIPVAQKPRVGSLDRAAVRDALGLPRDAAVHGVGGLNHPAKRIDEVVAAFARSKPGPDRWLLVSLVDEDDQTADEIMGQWSAMLKDGDLSQVRLRVGQYGDWEWMCGFYQAVDALLVNSRYESWCRMVSEALGFGVPLLVRRAPCASNHVAPGLVLVDDLADLDGPGFHDALAEARAKAAALREFVESNHSLDMVRAATLGILRKNTPPEEIAFFDRLAEDHEQRELLDTVLVY